MEPLRNVAGASWLVLAAALSAACTPGQENKVPEFRPTSSGAAIDDDVEVYARACFADGLKIKAVKPIAGKESAAPGWGTPAEKYFDCTQGSPTSMGKSVPPKCEKPGWLTGSHCYEGTYLQQVDFEPLPGVALPKDLDGVLLCRHKAHGPPYKNDEFDDIAMILRNRTTGETCWFQTNDGSHTMDGTKVPAPHFGAEARAFWLTPASTASIDCSQCHDNDAYAGSPFIRSANVLPKGKHYKYSNFGSPFAAMHKPKWVSVGKAGNKNALTPKGELAVGVQPCNDCHHIAKDHAKAPTAPLSGQTATHWYPWYQQDKGQSFLADDGTMVAVGDEDNDTVEIIDHTKPDLSRGMPPGHDMTELEWEKSYRGHVDLLRDCMFGGGGAACVPQVAANIPVPRRGDAWARMHLWGYDLAGNPQLLRTSEIWDPFIGVVSYTSAPLPYFVTWEVIGPLDPPYLPPLPGATVDASCVVETTFPKASGGFEVESWNDTTGRVDILALYEGIYFVTLSCDFPQHPEVHFYSETYVDSIPYWIPTPTPSPSPSGSPSPSPSPTPSPSPSGSPTASPSPTPTPSPSGSPTSSPSPTPTPGPTYTPVF